MMNVGRQPTQIPVCLHMDHIQLFTYTAIANQLQTTKVDARLTSQGALLSNSRKMRTFDQMILPPTLLRTLCSLNVWSSIKSDKRIQIHVAINKPKDSNKLESSAKLSIPVTAGCSGAMALNKRWVTANNALRHEKSLQCRTSGRKQLA